MVSGSSEILGFRHTSQGRFEVIYVSGIVVALSMNKEAMIARLHA